MQAIQIKYLGCTKTQDPRLKAWSKAGQIIEIYSHAGGIEAQARELAQRFADKFNWGKIVGFGRLPNEDYVATLEEK